MLELFTRENDVPKTSAYYFYVNRDISVDFQIFIIVPLS